jgi:O-antigen/teichoic acid export membrane protein
MLRGAQAQVAWHAVRLVVQIGSVPVLVGVWGLHLYGEWLILFAVPSYLSFSDLGMFSAAANDMIIRVARGDREGALDVFQASSVGVGFLLAAVTLGLLILVSVAPITSWLHLRIIHEFSAGWILIALTIDTFLVSYGGILYGGFSCVGRYGEGGLLQSAVWLGEFAAMSVVVLAGSGPAVAATAMLLARLLGTSAVYVVMRRRVPWLRFGRPKRFRPVLRPLVSPALASGAITAGLALNVQAMVILIGVTLGPASVAVFSTLRTMSRAVIQLVSSVFSVITPEVSKAFAEHDTDRIRALHRGGCQAAVWISAPILLILAVFGHLVVRVWTGGAINTHGLLLDIFLVIAGLESLWVTSFGVMYARNRHQRLGAVYFVLSAVTLPIAWALQHPWGLDGSAASILVLEVVMTVTTLHQALPATNDTLGGWMRSLIRPGFVIDLLRPVHRRDAAA